MLIYLKNNIIKRFNLLKKNFLLFFVISALLFSCNNSTAVTEEEVMGFVEVSLPASRSWTNSDVSALSTDFEILVYNDVNQLTSGLLTTGGVHQIAVPIGTYNVLVLAGIPDGYSSCSSLTGLGEAKAVVVTDSAITSVPVALDTFSFTTNWPSTTLTAGTSYDLITEVVFPVTSISLVSSSTYYTLDSNDSTTTWVDSGNKTFTGTTTLNLPASAGDFTVTLRTVQHFRLVDSDYSLNMSLSDITNNSWLMFPSYYPSDAIFQNEFASTITTELGSSSGLAVDITWNP